MDPLKNTSISFVIPCLNEEGTLRDVITQIKKTITENFDPIKSEIIVSDNGSTDQSIQIAKEMGAKVFLCIEKGYGAALQNGIKNASQDIIIFADADSTYDFSESPRLVNKLLEGYELVLGSRLKGNIHQNAMPFLHRHLGTPVLTKIIKIIYPKNSKNISDCNSGFRCFYKNSFNEWNVKSIGMEFASEMLIKALKSNSKISEVPASLRPNPPNRIPHLKTWRDGMRHLLQILRESPDFFYNSGFSISILSWILIIFSSAKGPIRIGTISLFGIHTMIFLILFCLFGLSLWSIGLVLATQRDSGKKLYNKLITLSEEKVFWSCAWIFLISFTFFLFIFIDWARHDFIFLNLEKQSLLLLTFGVTGIWSVFSIITAHLIKK